MCAPRLLLFAVCWVPAAGCVLSCAADSRDSDDPEASALPATLGVFDDYEHCVTKSSASERPPWPSDCVGTTCVDYDLSRRVLDQVREVLDLAGVRDHYTFVDARSTPSGEVELTHVVAIDWFKSHDTITFPAEMSQVEAIAAVSAAYCLDLPSLRPYEEVERQIARCSNATPELCENVLGPDCEPIVSGHSFFEEQRGGCWLTQHMAGRVSALEGEGVCGTKTEVDFTCE